jgi:hypothetical protein
MLLFGEDISDTYKKDLDRKIRQDLQKAMEEDAQEELRTKEVSDSLEEEKNHEKKNIKKMKNEKMKKEFKIEKDEKIRQDKIKEVQMQKEQLRIDKIYRNVEGLQNKRKNESIIEKKESKCKVKEETTNDSAENFVIPLMIVLIVITLWLLSVAFP